MGTYIPANAQVPKCHRGTGFIKICALRARKKINSQFYVLRRPSGKARKRRNIGYILSFRNAAGGMHRRLKCEVIFARALKASRRVGI